MKWSVARGIALTLAAVVTVCGGWLLLAPTTVGGPVSLVITSGVSMQPTFHTGDLAVLRSSSTYHVGDVVGYHSPTLRGAVVMHRLVAADGSRWTTKGDHNSWLDPDHPTSADIVGKLWLHVPRGGFLLTRILLPLAFVGFIGLLVPFRKRRDSDEDGDPVEPVDPRPARGTSRGRHARSRGSARPASARVPELLSRQTCVRALAGGLALAILGAAAFIVGVVRPQHRSATVARSWQTTATFGWTGNSGAGLIYPGGHLNAPDPIFPKVVDQITVTSQVTAHGRALGSPILTATLSDASGWSHSWPLDQAGERVGPSVHLSAPLDLQHLLEEVAWVQTTTGVTSPATLTLTVGDQSGAAIRGPSLAFALSSVSLKPQGPLTVTRSGSTSTATSVPATLTVSGHKVSVRQVRQIGATAVAVGLIVALAAGLLGRRMPTPTAEDILSQRFEGRVVHLADSDALNGSCLDVTEVESLAAFADTPSAVLYVVGSGDRRVLIAERGATRLRYVRNPASLDGAQGPSLIPDQRNAPAEADIVRGVR